MRPASTPSPSYRFEARPWGASCDAARLLPALWDTRRPHSPKSLLLVFVVTLSACDDQPSAASDGEDLAADAGAVDAGCDPLAEGACAAPREVMRPLRAAEVRVGLDEVCVRTTTDRLVCWGDDSTHASRFDGFPRRIRALSVGDDGVAVVMRDGNVAASPQRYRDEAVRLGVGSPFDHQPMANRGPITSVAYSSHTHWCLHNEDGDLACIYGRADPTAADRGDYGVRYSRFGFLDEMRWLSVEPRSGRAGCGVNQAGRLVSWLAATYYGDIHGDISVLNVSPDLLVDLGSADETLNGDEVAVHHCIGGAKVCWARPAERTVACGRFVVTYETGSPSEAPAVAELVPLPLIETDAGPLRALRCDPSAEASDGGVCWLDDEAGVVQCFSPMGDHVSPFGPTAITSFDYAHGLICGVRDADQKVLCAAVHAPGAEGEPRMAVPPGLAAMETEDE